MNSVLQERLSSDAGVLLHTAAQKGLVRAAQFLIESGSAAVGSHLGNFGTPLHTAADHNQLEIVKLLVEHGAALDETNSYGLRPLHTACKAGHVQMVKLLLELGANVASPPQGIEQRAVVPSELHFAAVGGHVAVMKLLLARFGALVNVQEAENGFAPLHVVTIQNNTKALSLLLDAGATVGLKTDNRESALHLAAAYSDTDMIKLLLARGASTEERTSSDVTALHLAMRRGQIENARVLIDFGGARVDPVSGKGLTPLREMAQEGMVPELQFIVNKGGNVNARDFAGVSVLQAAAREGHFEVWEPRFFLWFVCTFLGLFLPALPGRYQKFYSETVPMLICVMIVGWPQYTVLPRKVGGIFLSCCLRIALT
jgi:ankyrin